MAVNNTFQGFSAGTGGFSVNTGAFPGLSLEQTNKIKEQSKLMSTNPYDQMLIQDDMYKQELTKQKHENFVQERQAGRMELEQRTQNATDPKVKATNSSVKSMAALADMYRQYGYEHGKNWDDMQDEELVSRFNTKNPQVKKLADNFLTGGDDSEYRLAQQLGLSQDGYLKWKGALAKEQLDDAFWSNVWTKMKVGYNQSLDTLEKSIYRTSRDVENAYNEMWKYLANNVSLKKRMEKKLGREVSDEEYQQLVQRSLDQYDQNIARNKQEVLDQMGIVNYEAKKYADKNKLNEDIEAYYNNKSMTKSLLEGDFKGFFYKSAGDMAQNWEMLPIIGVTAMNPTAGKILMGTDSYLKESQEAFENMLNNGATFEEAEKGAVVVGLVNAGVEVGLESLLGGVETRSADAIRKTFMKNIQQEAVNRGFWRTVMQAGGEYFKASGEEGLEEVVQQIVQNAAAKTVNENQKLFEGIGLAFEGGAYNPLNLLAGGNINRNYSNNVNLGNNVNTETNTETNTTEANTENQGILDKVTDYGAELITNTVSAQDKLYKAQEPRMNTLTSKKNLENRRANSDRANQLIVENGYLPTNTSERVEAHQATLNKLWNQVKSKINEGKGIPVDQSSIIEVLENYINEKKNLNVAAIEGDIAALEKELESLKKSQEEGTADLPVLENKKQVYNDIANWKEHEASKVYNDGIKLITAEIGKIEDQLLSEIPGEFSNLKKDVGALIDSYEDVFKADMKNQRSKGVGLTEAYSRIEGIGDMIEGALGIFKGEGGKVIQGAGKVLLGKSLAKAKDSDFLIEQGFKGLAEELKNKSNVGLDKSQASSKTAKFQKYGMAKNNEKGMSAKQGLNIRNFKNGKTVQELANQYGIDTKIVDSISTPEGQRAYGMYGDRLITLSKDLKESTVPHELLHGVFDMVDSKRRTSILEGIQKNLNIDNVQAEEWLADNFSEYYRTGKFGTQGLAKTFVEKVKQFFYEIKKYIDGTYKNEKQIRQLFDDIIDGKIEGEYGVYSDPKFQSVWHGSPADFERFDSTHMGEGEGAQAHGWGHYVAKDKSTGEHYADMVDKGGYRSRYKGKTRENIAQETRYDKGPSELNSAYEIVKRMDYDNMSFEEARDAAIKTQQNTIDMHNNLLKYGNYEDYGWSKERLENYVKEENENIKILKSFNEKDFEIGKKNLYEVEIPDPIKKDTPTGSNYFEEDSFVENNAVDKIVKAVKDSGLEVGEREGNWKGIDKMVDSYNTEKGIHAKNMYHILKVVLGSDKAASKFLESLGYDGIHYFGGRDGEAYVIFNDDALQITKHHKY